MKKTRITVPVSIEEREGLRFLSSAEMRDPREQVRYLIRRELVSRGILVENSSNTAVRQDKAGVAVDANL